MQAMTPIILIPARMASTRLPGKPLADIHGKPMIVRVWEQAMAAGSHDRRIFFVTSPDNGFLFIWRSENTGAVIRLGVA